MVSVLPPAIATQYADPAAGASLLRPPADVFLLNLSEPLRPPCISGSRHEYVKLVLRACGVGMMGWTGTPHEVNGVFTVGKDIDCDRLIIDAQPANRRFVDSPHVNLPDASHLVLLHVPQGHQMFVAKSDLSNYYHHLGLPEWMQPFFALPPLTEQECLEAGLDPSTPYPMCLTLPMGFSHAVFLGNTAHEHIVYGSGVLRPEHNLLQMANPTLSSHHPTHGIIIDDFFMFCLDQQLASRVFARVLAAYRAAGLVVKPSKVVEPTASTVKVIGFDICGSNATVQLPCDSQLSLLRDTLGVLRRGVATGLGLAHLIGRWTHVMLLRRPSLAVLQHVYRYIERADRRRFTLWPSVRRELWMLVGLLPLLHARLDIPFFHNIIASDASELAAGVTCTSMTDSLHRRLWPVCSSREHATMQTVLHAACAPGRTGPTVLDVYEHAYDPQLWAQDLTPPQQRSLLAMAMHAYASLYADVSSTCWSTVISSPWRNMEHINELELRAVLLALHWALSYPSSHSSRVYLLVDSTVTLFALWKGRCSSPRLLIILRKINALLLASGVTLLTGWLPTDINPADAPSRLQTVRGYRAHTHE